MVVFGIQLNSQVNRLAILGEKSILSFFDLSTEKANKTSSYGGFYVCQM